MSDLFLHCRYSFNFRMALLIGKMLLSSIVLNIIFLVLWQRNAFLEAESLEMSRERGRIRYEMRGLLVNNEDLIRNMAVMQNELKKLKDRVLELERENFTLNESITHLEVHTY